MEVQMRLAERAGLLTGNQLSSVQYLALEMLYLIDKRENTHNFMQDLKSRIVAAHPSEFPTLFPEWGWNKTDTETQEFDKARKPDGTYDEVDDDKIAWSSPASEAENDEIERWIEGRKGGVVSAVELEANGWH